MSSIIGDDLILLLTEQSNFYHIKNAEKWKISPEMVQYHTWRNGRVFGTNNFDGTSRKRKYKRLLVHWPYNFHTHFSSHWVGTVLNPFGRPGILVTTASKHRIQDGYSKFGPCMNILYRNWGQYTVQNKNCHLMKPWSHGGVAWNLGHTIQGK